MLIAQKNRSIFARRSGRWFVTPVSPPFAGIQILDLKSEQSFPEQRRKTDITIIFVSGAPRGTITDGQRETFKDRGDSLMVPAGQEFEIGMAGSQTTFLIIHNPDRGFEDEIIVAG